MFGECKGRYGGVRPHCKECRTVKESHKIRKDYKDEWYQKNKSEVLSKWKVRSLTDEFKATRKRLYRKNKPQILWRSVLRRVLVQLKQKKTARTKEMLGYGPEELRKHIELLWLPEMTWENHGEWHLDHIRPVCTFPLDAKVSEVNALSNLQPLWATTRITNGIKVIGNLNKQRRILA